MMTATTTRTAPTITTIGTRDGTFDIWSLGADNREGGEGEDRDVTSWE